MKAPAGTTKADKATSDMLGDEVGIADEDKPGNNRRSVESMSAEKLGNEELLGF